MDPGLALGAVSLIFQVFSGCVKGYQLLSEARDLASNHQYFRIRFKTEQYRLLDWASIVNLSEDDWTLSVGRNSRPVVIDILDQQSRLMLRFGRLDDKLRPLATPLLSEEHDSQSDLGDNVDWDTQTLTDSVQSRFPDTNVLLRKSIDFIHKTSRFPTRLRWAISDKDKIGELLAKLSTLNDYLDDMLNNHQLQLLNIQQTRTNYQIMQLNNKIDQLRELVAAGLVPIERVRYQPSHFRSSMKESSEHVTDGPDNGAQANPNDDLVSLARFKALRAAIESGNWTEQFRKDLGLEQSQPDSRPARLSPTEIQIDSKAAIASLRRVAAMLTLPKETSRKVWIEWKSVEPTLSPSAGKDGETMVSKRFEALVQLLRQDKYTGQFRAVPCLGYYVHEKSSTESLYGLVLQNPNDVDDTALPCSLIDHILQTQKQIPSLSARMSLMRTLAECVERLHAVDWLHKGLRSQNVIFFPSPSGKIDLSRPYLSGFEYSRPEGAEYMSESPPALASEDLYRHPAVQGGPHEDVRGFGYKKHHDVYSLGVVLLEIVYWRPIYAVLGFDAERVIRPTQAASAKSRLLRGECESYIRSHVGDLVADVVIACLTGLSAFGVAESRGEQDAKKSAKFQEGFFDVVVSNLQKLKV